MSARYAVIGNPVAHSRSPSIHARFARQTHADLEYGAILAPLDGFVEAAERFRDAGGSGLNVTLPFKREAYRWAERRSARAEQAGAVNTLRFDAEPGASRAIAFGDNTDGAGLVADLVHRQRFALADRAVLLLGAGGAARGVVGPLLQAGVSRLVVANRSPANAVALVDAFRGRRGVVPTAVALEAIEPGFDLVLDATGSGLRNEPVPLPAAVFAGASLAYDLFYRAAPTVFVRQALAAGCARACDGLGMLVEQAAESFLVWRGIRPDTDPVYDALRAELAAAVLPS